MSESIIYEEGKTKIKSVVSGTTEILIIASVKSIFGFDDKNYAFKDCCSTISTIKFQENSNLEIIEPYAFYKCKQIKNLDLSKCTKLTEIRRSAFNTTNLGTIQLPQSLKVLEDSAFAYSGLTTITIPKLVGKLDEKCFCGTLQSITFDDESQCTAFGGYCFRYSGIKTIRIPKNLETHGWGCFEACGSLTSYTVQDGSAFYSAHDGVLYNEDQTILHFCPAAKTGAHKVASTTLTIDSTSFIDTHLTTIELPDGLQSIGSYTFSSPTLTSIELPDTVTGIGAYCFNSCGVLSSIKFSSKMTSIPEYCFSYTAFESIVIPEGIVSIGQSCFQGCTKLKSITLPKSLKNLGGGVFAECNIKELQIHFNDQSDLYFNSNLGIISNTINTSLKQYLGEELTLEVPASYTEISSKAFYNLKITEITFAPGNQLQSIGASAFYYCSELSTIEIPNTVTSIGESAFKGCTKLAKMILPGSLETIDKSAFMSSSVTEIDFQQCIVKDIPQEVFSQCKSLKIMSLPPQLETIGLQCFANCELLSTLTLPNTFINFSKEAFIGSGITEVTFESEPTNLESICDYAFYSATKLETFVIPASVTSIGLMAFWSTNLIRVDIPSKCREIKDYCFSKCPQLDMFNVKENSQLETLGYCVFEDSRSLREFVCNNNHFTVENGALLKTDRTLVYAFPPKSPFRYFAFPQRVKTISRSSFYGCDNLIIILIPDDSVETIETKAFSYCSNLEMINIPESVKEIGTDSFIGCDKLICGIKVDSKSILDSLITKGKMKKSALSNCSNLKTCNDKPSIMVKSIMSILFTCFIISN